MLLHYFNPTIHGDKIDDLHGYELIVSEGLIMYHDGQKRSLPDLGGT